ncbi:MAG: ATP-dependent DNA helicase RecG, partial [Firmicutes bacterium]|nr:ATP-dependent DNA helicase RecG [Bacillota bacterium]
ITPLNAVVSGQEATVIATVVSASYDFSRALLRVVVGDGRATLHVTFFHAAWLRRQIVEGARIMLSGMVEARGRHVGMTHPEFQVLKAGEKPLLGIVPIYPLAGQIKQRFLQQLMEEMVGPLSAQSPEPLSPAMRERLHLMGRAQAILTEHRPPSFEALEEARRRLVFDEFLKISLAVLMLNQAPQQKNGSVQRPDGPLAQKFLRQLPFHMTPGQQSAWQEIRRDLFAPAPMARLLQGDVGSGKTLIAILAMLAAVDAGRQAAFMAPTEILAQQQWQVMQQWLSPLGIPVGLLTGSESKAAMIREELRSGALPLVVGTQALISDKVQFQDLGVVVIDEQHRFGVKQRAFLSLKGTAPDILVMTATPIPRTLALTVYGDLEVSHIQGLPPGRQPIRTVHLNHRDRRQAYEFVRQAVREGQQAYVVCPQIGESDETSEKAVEMNAKAAVDLAEGMQKLPGWRIGLLHGKLSEKEKSSVMQQFRQHELDVLVATTIIEVGVDVPNATVMVIEGADRFGLAQLHQLRGRIGRGNLASTCFLIADPTSEESVQRIDAMVQYTDGLLLAEEDLRIRGPGEVLGLRQHGVAGFQLANPLKDLEWLQLARDEARAILARDPLLQDPDHAVLKQWVTDALGDALPSRVLH